MKKKHVISFLLGTILVTSFIFKSCSDHEKLSVSKEMIPISNLKAISFGREIKVDLKDAKNVSKQAFMLGISEIHVSSINSDKLNIKLKAANSIINDRKIMLDGEEFTLEKRNENTSYIISDLKNKSTLEYDFNTSEVLFNYKGSIITSNELKKGRELGLAQKFIFLKLLIISEQLMNNDIQTATYGDWVANLSSEQSQYMNARSISEGENCTRYNISFGFTRSEAESKAGQDKMDFLRNYPTCSMIGQIDVTCLGTISPCVATVTFTCSGAICDQVGPITE